MCSGNVTQHKSRCSNGAATARSAVCTVRPHALSRLMTNILSVFSGARPGSRERASAHAHRTPPHAVSAWWPPRQLASRSLHCRSDLAPRSTPLAGHLVRFRRTWPARNAISESTHPPAAIVRVGQGAFHSVTRIPAAHEVACWITTYPWQHLAYELVAWCRRHLARRNTRAAW